MAFEIGERVTSTFTGPGTIMGPLERDKYGVAFQRVRFDNPLFGERLREVQKMGHLDTDESIAKVSPTLTVYLPGITA